MNDAIDLVILDDGLINGFIQSISLDVHNWIDVLNHRRISTPTQADDPPTTIEGLPDDGLAYETGAAQHQHIP